MASVPSVPPKRGLIALLRSWMGIGPWNSNPGPYTGGPLAFTESGLIPMNWPMNFGQVGYDPLPYPWNAAVYACVMRYAWTISQLPGKHKHKLANGGVEDVTTSALYRIFRQPNAYQDIQDLLLNLIVNMMRDGNGYGLAIRNDRGEVTELHWLNPRNTRVVVATTGDVFYSIGGNEIIDKTFDPMLESEVRWTVPQRDILHLRMFCPRHPLIGESPLVAAGPAVMLQALGSAGLAAYYQNMSRPSGVLMTDIIMTPEQVVQLRERWDAQAKGLGVGGVPILTAGLKYQPQSIGFTAADAQVAESQKAGVAEIARVFGVPLALINDMTGSTFANTEQLMRAWLAMGLAAVINKIELSFDRLFGLVKMADDFTEFEMEALLRPEWKQVIDGLGKSTISGIHSPNEARAIMGLPAAEEGDEPRMQAQVVPLSAAAQIQATPAAPAGPAPPAAPANDDQPANGGDSAAQNESQDDVVARLRGLMGFNDG